jgi:hypothetical protein
MIGLPSGQIDQIDDSSFGHFFSGIVFALLDEGYSDDSVCPILSIICKKLRKFPQILVIFFHIIWRKIRKMMMVGGLRLG